MMKIVCRSLVSIWFCPECRIEKATGKRHRARITESLRLAEPARSFRCDMLDLTSSPGEHVSPG